MDGKRDHVRKKRMGPGLSGKKDETIGGRADRRSDGRNERPSDEMKDERKKKFYLLLFNSREEIEKRMR